MSTSHFRSLCALFMRGVVDKSRALHTADQTGLNAHQRRCLRESVGVDVRKVCDSCFRMRGTRRSARRQHGCPARSAWTVPYRV
jgi:hypothetical protein